MLPQKLFELTLEDDLFMRKAHDQITGIPREQLEVMFIQLAMQVRVKDRIINYLVNQEVGVPELN